MLFRWAILDVETTGLSVVRDKITEIAVIVMTEKGVEMTWSSLINPRSTLPAAVSHSTGITQEMVAQAPCFEAIAEKLMALLDGCVFVAHNARFNYAFIKNAFKKLNLSLNISVLCTIKLFKALYPDAERYNLGYLADRYQIATRVTHRAVADVQILQALIELTFRTFPSNQVLKTATLIYKKAYIPATLMTDIQTIPNSPGVYIFYGSESEFPLYIGKSIRLRQRVISHFQADHSNATEFKMAQQVERVDIIPTAGELSALLLESSLVKEKMPLYNRRLRRKKTIVGFTLEEKDGYLTVVMVQSMCDANDISSIYGSFRNRATAKANLLRLIKDYQLCPKICGIERAATSCFSYQLKRCLGACIGEETPLHHNARLNEAFRELKEMTWPFKGSIAIKENCPVNQLTQFMVFNQWRHLGTVVRKEELNGFIPQHRTHDFDTYKILSNYLNGSLKSNQIIVLE